MSELQTYSRTLAENRAVNESSKIVFLSVDAICPNRAQPRNRFDTNTMIRLADSVRRYGILQPLTVRLAEPPSNPREQSAPIYELVAGERRLRAAKLAGLQQVPCIITSADDHLSAELAVIENLIREDLNMFEQARAFGRLIIRFSLTQEQIARKMSMSQSAVANKLRLLKFNEEEQQQILSGGLTERHARTLLRLPAGKQRLIAIGRVIAEKMNVAACESLVDSLLDNTLEDFRPGSRSELKKDAGAGEPTGRKKLVLKDLRIFYNSIERAVDILKQTGLHPEIEQKEEGGRVVISIALDDPSSAHLVNSADEICTEG